MGKQGKGTGRPGRRLLARTIAVYFALLVVLIAKRSQELGVAFESQKRAFWANFAAMLKEASEQLQDPPGRGGRAGPSTASA